MRRILFLSPFPPRRDGMHGSSIAAARAVLAIATQARVALICLRADDEPGTDPETAAICEHVVEVRRESSLAARLAYTLRAVATGRPAWVECWRSEAFRRELRRMAADWKPDVVQFELNVMAQYRDAVPAIPAVLTIHEPPAAAAAELLVRSGFANRLRLRREERAWRRFDAGVMPSFQGIVCLSERDAAVVQPACGGVRVEVIAPAGVPRNVSFADGETILFAGNFMHPPNADAALWLAREILPLVRTRRPAARLTIAGASPPREVRALASDHVTVTGMVPSMEPFVRDAAVVALPLRLGGGVRMKALEALGAGKAIVATALAVEGLDLTEGREYVRAETAAEFAGALGALLGDHARRRRLGTAAAAWAEAVNSPQRLGARWSAVHAAATSAAPVSKR